MILFLFGSDTYRSGKKLEEIVARYKAIHESGLSFHIFDEERCDFQEFKNALYATPMLGEKKLIVLKYVARVKEFRDAFLAWPGKDNFVKSKDIVIVFLEREADKKDPWIFWILKNSKSQEFKVLSGMGLQKWCKAYLLKHRILMENSAFFRLLQKTGGDLWTFENEIAKLKAYARSTRGEGGDGVEISSQDLNAFFRAPLEMNIFGFIDAFAEQNKARALKLLHGHLASGDEPQYLFSMLYHQIRNIALASDLCRNGERNVSNIARILSLHPYVAQKSVAQARRFGKEQIQQLYKILVELERDTKTGAYEPCTSFERLIFAPLSPSLGQESRAEGAD
ncbi:MAG: DNA polymerase III subunit delta [Candidatus Spechtbacteria bacterium]|nr:DNA polymerase III subunit delta [Candidatus Spechtbacteria bacterium]